MGGLGHVISTGMATDTNIPSPTLLTRTITLANN
jgi:hypothetical protein